MHSSLWQGHGPQCTGQRANAVGQQALQAADIQRCRKGSCYKGTNMASRPHALCSFSHAQHESYLFCNRSVHC